MAHGMLVPSFMNKNAGDKIAGSTDFVRSGSYDRNVTRGSEESRVIDHSKACKSLYGKN